MSTPSNKKNKIKMVISNNLYIYMPTFRADYKSPFLLSFLREKYLSFVNKPSSHIYQKKA
jgi:hypothetical protein